MEKRKLGRSGMEVAPLAFGGNVFGWTTDEQRSHQLLDAFVGSGFNLIDTSDSYSRWAHGNQGGESETIIGTWLKKSGQRKNVLIATKVGSDMGLGRTCLTKQYILEEAEASLCRLQTDYIDLYQTHFDDLSTPVGETLEAYAQLIKEGKVRAIGASNLSKERLLESLRFSKDNNLPRYETFQPEYNLYNREQYEKEYEPICREEELGVINYFALASGFLTGKYRTAADETKSVRGDTIIEKYLNDRGLRILAALDEIAKRHNTNQSSIAIAWLLTKPEITAPIASATSVEQLAELIQAVKLKLDPESLHMLNEASAY
ncbi:MAG TPA: aldo/keto reductase [Chitinophagaceae bacterium]|nr:aldo/keto reductase [Chitinophagaceae bacterium]